MIKALIAKGKKRGFLTYEEMNNALPDDAVSSSRLERLLATLDEMGISLIDENDAEAREAAKGDEEFEEDGAARRGGRRGCCRGRGRRPRKKTRLSRRT